MKEIIRTTAQINIYDSVFLNFIRFGNEELHDDESLIRLLEVLPEEAISTEKQVSISPTRRSPVEITECLNVSFNIDNNDLTLSEKYYRSICDFFKIDNAYQNEIWNELLVKYEVGTKVLMNCMMKDYAEREIDFEFKKLRDDLK